MFVFSLKFDIEKAFMCHEAIEAYICYFCSFATQERLDAIEHSCKFNVIHNKGIYKYCKKCKMTRFINLWQYYQRKKNSNFNNRSLLNELTDNLGVAQNCCILINLKKNKSHFGQPRSQFKQCKSKLIICQHITLKYTFVKYQNGFNVSSVI